MDDRGKFVQVELDAGEVVLKARVGVDLCYVTHFLERSLVVKVQIRIGLLGVGVAFVQIAADMIAVILISLVGVIGGHVLACGL